MKNVTPYFVVSYKLIDNESIFFWYAFLTVLCQRIMLFITGDIDSV